MQSSASREVYATAAQPATTEREERGGPRFFMRRLQSVREAVRIEDVAAEYGEFRAVGGGRLVGRCVSPTHPDRTPSMSVYTAGQRFRCFGCGEGGDVLDMVMLAEGGDLREAVEELARRYHVALPERPPAWHRKRERQKPIRDKIEEVRVEAAKRRLWRYVFEPMVRCVEDSDARIDLGDYVWDEVLPLAVRMADRDRAERRAEQGGIRG